MRGCGARLSCRFICQRTASCCSFKIQCRHFTSHPLQRARCVGCRLQTVVDGHAAAKMGQKDTCERVAQSSGQRMLSWAYCADAQWPRGFK